MRKLELGTVLVATDLSEGSDAIMRSAAALAAVAGADLRALHVMELEAAPYVELAGVDASFPGRIQSVEGELDQQLSRVLGGRVQASGKVVIDTVHRALLAEAESVGAGVIVLGAHRKRPVADGVLGSTADRVIRNATVPSLVLRGDMSLPLRRVVAPMDFSEPSRAAVSLAADWCRALGDGGELRVVHVVPRVFIGDEFSIDRGAIEKGLHDQVTDMLSGSGEGIDVTEEVVWGEGVADDIIQYARERDADLLVIGTHGHGAFKRLLIGSVAAHVVRHASGPVLLVPPAMWRDDD